MWEVINETPLVYKYYVFIMKENYKLNKQLLIFYNKKPLLLFIVLESDQLVSIIRLIAIH